MKIANKISIVFLVTSVSLALFVLSVIYMRTAQIIKSAAVNNLTTATESRANHLVTYINGSKEAAQQLSKSVVIKKLLSSYSAERGYDLLFREVQVRLADTQAARECMTIIDVLDKEGRVVLSTVEAQEGIRTAGWEQFRQVKENTAAGKEDTVIRDAFWCPLSSKRTWGIFAPVLDNKRNFIGAVYVRFDMGAIDQIVSRHIGSWVTGEAYLINSGGRMITPSRYLADTFLKSRVSDDMRKRCFSGTEEVSTASIPDIYSNYRGVRVVGVFSYIPGVRWCLFSEVQAQEAWGLLNDIKLMFLVLFFFSILVTWIMSVVISRWFLGPIQNLKHGAAIIGRGNLEYKLRTDHKDELGSLAVSINEMTDELKKTTTTRDYVNNIIESLTYSLIVASPDNCTIRTVNQAAADLLGYSKTELIGKELSEIFAASESRPCSCAEIKALISQGKLRKYEMFSRTKKGLYVPVLFSSTLLREAGRSEGETSGILCLAEDITEQKKTREALKESEQRLGQIMQGTAIPLFVINQQHRIIYWNRACEVLTGFSSREMIGTTDQWKSLYSEKRPTIADLLFEPDPEKKLRRYFPDAPWKKSVLIDGAYEVEGFYSSLGQEGKWLHGTAAPIKDSRGEIMAVIETLEDITERKKAEAEIRESGQRLTEIVSGAAIPVFVIDKDHRVTHWNKSCERLTGFSAKEIIGTRKHWIPFYTSPRPLLADLLLDNISEDVLRNFYQGGEIKKTGLMEQAYEVESFFSILGEKGAWLRFTAAPIKNSRGEMIAAIETLEDITERKRLYQLKDEFVSTVSHELRTPLTTIREAVSQMYDGILGETSEDQKDVLSVALSDIDRLARIINNLLDISKIEAGEVELHREEVDMTALVRDVVTLFSPQARVKGLDIRTVLPEERVMINVDRDKIIQVLNNLLGNALKFTHKGFIEVSLRDHANTVECVVRDTGLGIAEEYMPQMFSKFYQIGRGPGPGEKGTGLGLSIAKGIVELHSGGIGVESRLNEGSKFTIFLPKVTPRELFVEHVTRGMGEALKENMLLSVVVFKLQNLTELGSMLPGRKLDEIYDGLEREVQNSLHRHQDKFFRVRNRVYVIFLSEEKEDIEVLFERLFAKIQKYLSKKLHRYIKPRITRGIAVFPDDGNTAEEIVNAAEKRSEEE